jgi:hypothetical protein
VLQAVVRGDLTLAWHGAGAGEAVRWAGPVCTVPLSNYLKKFKQT